MCSEDCRPVIIRLPDTVGKTCYQFTATMAGSEQGSHRALAAGSSRKRSRSSVTFNQPGKGGWANLDGTAIKPAPNPYVRSSVTRDLVLGNFPSKEAYTVC